MTYEYNDILEASDAAMRLYDIACDDRGPRPDWIRAFRTAEQNELKAVYRYITRNRLDKVCCQSTILKLFREIRATLQRRAPEIEALRQAKLAASQVPPPAAATAPNEPATEPDAPSKPVTKSARKSKKKDE